MRFGMGLGLLAVILSTSPGVFAQDEKESPPPSPSPARKGSPAEVPSAGRTMPPERPKFERPGRGFGGDEGMPGGMGGFPMEDYEPEGPIDVPDPPVPDSTMDYLAAIGTLALAFGVVTAAAVMRVRRVLSADAAFKLIALSLIVVAGLSLLRSKYAPELMAPMMVVLGTALGFIFGKTMGSTVPEGAPAASPPVSPPPV